MGFYFQCISTATRGSLSSNHGIWQGQYHDQGIIPNVTVS